MIPPNTKTMTRQQALDAGIRKYWTGRPCKYGHQEFRATTNGICMQCAKDYQGKFRNGRVAMERLWKRAGLIPITVHVPASGIDQIKNVERDLAAPICANAAILLTRVLYTKQGGNKKFVIVDAGMNDLIRPSLYGAFHFIWPVRTEERFVPATRNKDLHIEGNQVVDVVGPICEGADFLAKDRSIPPVERGDLLAVFTAGAYGFTMSSNYNTRGRAAEVLVEGDSFRVIRRRETYEDQVALER